MLFSIKDSDGQYICDGIDLTESSIEKGGGDDSEKSIVDVTEIFSNKVILQQWRILIK